MRIIGLAGWSGAGKTTLLTRLIPFLTGQGLRVATIKHAHHAFDVDVPGKDSYAHRQAGAAQVLVSSANRWALMTELRGAPEPQLPDLLARLDKADLVIVEGFKRDPHPKIEVFRAANGKPWLHPRRPVDSRGGVGCGAGWRAARGAGRYRRGGGAGAAAGGLGAGPADAPRPPLMAQLSDDCFAFGGQLMGVAEAAALIAARVTPLPDREQVSLHAARGRVLAAPLLAPGPLPPFFNSAVDGYAFAHASLGSAETRLPLRGRAPAGVAAAALAPGAAMRIFTGAPMPAGADTVMMQEDAALEGETLLLPAGLKRGANCRPAGEDVAIGAEALAAGTRLGPAEIGLAAALGVARLECATRLRVGVFSTGDELASPGQALGPAQTFDSNRFTLLALLAGLPVEGIDLGILPDQPGPTAAALAAAARTHDLLLTSGGVSAGEEDHVRAAIEGAGRLVFWRLAVKPGRPAAMGVIGGTPVLGLPGNPVAAVVCFLHLARPLILRLAGARPEELPRYPAVAGFAHRKKLGRREYLRVRLARDGAMLRADKFAREGAGLLTSLTHSDAFCELTEDQRDIAPGDAVQVLPFAGIM